ncbi:MAG: dihydrodipicolinate synthase family protein [Acidimicrobiales bacterium]|jgi:4-hydroxy-tetrahydrodipicolinate synthase|nr:dihydrodipicolinate synthase family protein [Acidimicrobiales bacterium]|tara:strand:+ start:571 stop:1461 length:891 start_codon:yes stop_codon:yes gene_type:complete
MLMQPGPIAPILTPFEDDHSISTNRYVNHAKRLLTSGCVGLVPFGTTGEALSLSTKERIDSLEALVDAEIDPSVLIPGTGLSNIPDTVSLSRHAVELGCYAVLILPPTFCTHPSEDGLYSHYANIISTVNDDRLRIFLYHIPQFASVGVPIEVVIRLSSAFPNVVTGIKDSSGDWSNTKKLFEIDNLVVYPGSERFLIQSLSLGSPGCITASANVNSSIIAQVVSLYTAGDHEGAHNLISLAIDYRNKIETFSMIPALKSILALQYDDPSWSNVRTPLAPLNESSTETLLQLFELY